MLYCHCNLKTTRALKEINYRKDHEAPAAIARWGWKYHHTGIPTDKPQANEKYIPSLKFYVSGFERSPFGIEWMRFEEGSPIHELVQKLPHVAFEVQNIEEEIRKHELNVITAPNPPSEGVRVAMIEHNGAPVELIEFEK